MQSVYSASTLRSIIAGPSKDTLILMLFNSAKLTKPWVEFTEKGGYIHEVVITGVERENNSDESFNIQGHMLSSRGPYQKVEIYYRTDRRGGNMKFVCENMKFV